MQFNQMSVYTLEQLGVPQIEKEGAASWRYRFFFGREGKEFRIHCFQQCSSSLDIAWSLYSESGLLTGDSVLCKEQSSGRGRMRRKWASPSGNIYSALHLPMPQNPGAARVLSILVGYCLVRVLRDKGVGVELKWPNDLVLSGKKVGGILVEEKQGAIMAGIGLNLQNCPEPEELRDFSLMHADSLSRTWPGPDNPLEAWGEIVYPLSVRYLNILGNFSLIDFVSEVRACLCFINQKIRVQTANGLKEGYFQGLNTEGGMILDCQGNREDIQSGHIV